MSNSADWQSVIEVITPHSSTPRVLLLAEGEGWSLPLVSIDDLWAVDELLELGCFDWRLERLSAQAATLAADAVALRGLTDAERAQVRAAHTRLQAMCAALAACGIPHTLVHGDLHLHNVAANTGSYLFFDWTDACVSHPFFDLNSVFDDEDRARQEQLRDAYLDVWSDCAPPKKLRDAWTLAQPLSDLHQTMSYQHILVGLEPSAQAEFGDSVPYYVRKVLQALRPPRGEHDT